MLPGAWMAWHVGGPWLLFSICWNETADGLDISQLPESIAMEHRDNMQQLLTG
jgi:hypothetical protein